MVLGLLAAVLAMGGQAVQVRFPDNQKAGFVLFCLAAALIMVTAWVATVGVMGSGHFNRTMSLVVCIAICALAGGLSGLLIWVTYPDPSGQTVAPSDSGPISDLPKVSSPLPTATPLGDELPKKEPAVEKGKEPAKSKAPLPAAPPQTTTRLPPITQGPGSALSFNQQGGITAGTVVVNPGIQPPTVTAKVEVDQVEDEARFRSEVVVTVSGQMAIPLFGIRVDCETFDDIELRKGGISMYNISKAPTFGIFKIQNAIGAYRVVVWTRTKAKCDIQWSQLPPE